MNGPKDSMVHLKGSWHLLSFLEVVQGWICMNGPKDSMVHLKGSWHLPLDRSRPLAHSKLMRKPCHLLGPLVHIALILNVRVVVVRHLHVLLAVLRHNDLVVIARSRKGGESCLKGCNPLSGSVLRTWRTCFETSKAFLAVDAKLVPDRGACSCTARRLPWGKTHLALLGTVGGGEHCVWGGESFNLWGHPSKVASFVHQRSVHSPLQRRVCVLQSHDVLRLSQHMILLCHWSAWCAQSSTRSDCIVGQQSV